MCRKPVASPDPGTRRLSSDSSVTRVERQPGEALIHIDAGEHLVAKLTPGAASRLALDAGRRVYVIIKAHALRRVR